MACYIVSFNNILFLRTETSCAFVDLIILYLIAYKWIALLTITE